MNKDEKRSGYTKRMMEIMSSIKKQRAGIDKVGAGLCTGQTVLTHKTFKGTIQSKRTLF